MYNNAPQAGLASLVNSPYRDMDVMRVQMTPREVAGLQQIALSYGAREEDLYDPVTGEPRFLSLKNILPMIAGAVLGPAGFGLSPFAAAATVGIGYGLVEGDLKKGLMAGLGAYSGGKIGEGLKAAGEATAPAPEAPAIKPLRQPFQERHLMLLQDSFRLQVRPCGTNQSLSNRLLVPLQPKPVRRLDRLVLLAKTLALLPEVCRMSLVQAMQALKAVVPS